VTTSKFRNSASETTGEVGEPVHFLELNGKIWTIGHRLK